MKKDILVVGNLLGKKLSERLGSKFVPIEYRKFFDGELKVRVNGIKKNKWGIIIMDLYQNQNINEYLLHFILASAKVKEYCEKVIGVIPYLPYKRQDKEFLKGEAVSSKIMSKVLEMNLDYFITCDSHEHRLLLSDVFSIPSYNISEFMDLGKCFLNLRKEETIVIGPDSESKSFVERFCTFNGFEYMVLNKKRDTKTGKVVIELKNKDKIKGKNVIIVDDVSASGGTIEYLNSLIKGIKLKSKNLVLSHGLFIGDVEEKLKKLKFDRIVTSNTVFNEFMEVDCTLGISEQIKKIIKI